MSYYARPMGDYKTYGYAGDPGFLSSLWKGIKSVGKAVLGIPVPLPTGPGPAAPPPSFPGVGLGPQGMQLRPGGVTTRVPGVGRLPPYTATGPGVLAGGGITGELIPRGYHLAKDGSGKLVRNRRMNVANPRALRRSMRRVQGFEKLAKRTISFTRRVKMKR